MMMYYSIACVMPDDVSVQDKQLAGGAASVGRGIILTQEGQWEAALSHFTMPISESLIKLQWPTVSLFLSPALCRSRILYRLERLEEAEVVLRKHLDELHGVTNCGLAMS